MKKIIIMSDTHGDREQFIDILNKENADIAIHAGDYCIDYHEIKKHFDYVVAGNNDFIGPNSLEFEIDGIKFKLTHGHQYGNYLFDRKKRNESIFEDAIHSDVNVLISGHTHIEDVEEKDGILLINPGSTQKPRNSTFLKSYAILEIVDQKIKSKEFKDIIKYIS